MPETVISVEAERTARRASPRRQAVRGTAWTVAANLLNKMTNSFTKFLALEWGHKAVALRALIELPVVALFVDRLSAEWLSGETRERPFRGDKLASPHEPRSTALALARVVNSVAAILPLDARCLVRSVYLCRLLDKRQISCRLVLGAKTEANGRLAAHAWVEHAGEPINDVADIAQHFAPLAKRSTPESHADTTP